MPGFGQAVFVPQWTLLIGFTANDARSFQFPQAVSQQMPGDAQPLLKLLEPPHAQKAVAQNQHGPPVANDRKAARYRAGFISEVVPTHDDNIGMLDGFRKRTYLVSSFLELTWLPEPKPMNPVMPTSPAATYAAEPTVQQPAATYSPPLDRGNAVAASRMARTRRLLEGPIGPTLARLAAPNVIAMFVMSAMSIAEGIFAGSLGVKALAGLALVFPLVMLTQMLSAGAMGGAISSAVARALGGQNAPRAAGLAVTAWIIAIGAALLTALLMAVFGRSIFQLLGGGYEAVQAAIAYASVFFPGCIALWLCHSSLSIVRGTGNMLMPSLTLLIVSLASIPLSGALALGWGPVPAFGMAGLAAGPILAYGAGALAAISYIVAGRSGISLAGAFGRRERGLFADILRVGLIASLNTVQTVLTVVLMVGLVGHYGADSLAGYGLGARLEFLMVPIVFGIGSAMTAMVGANIGAGARPRALRIAWTGSFAAAFLVGSIGIAVSLDPDLWLSLFLEPSELGALAAGRAYFHTVGPFYGFFALGLALYFASQGAGRMVWPVSASLCRMAVAIGGGLLLARGTGMGIDGVFVAIAGGMLVYGLVTAAAVKLTGWR